jgi:hypothetical protein
VRVSSSRLLVRQHRLLIVDLNTLEGRLDALQEIISHEDIYRGVAQGSRRSSD